MNNEYNSWIVVVKTDDEEETPYYACASVKRHLESSLRVPARRLSVKGRLRVLEVTDTTCKAVFEVDENDDVLVDYMLPEVSY